VLPAGTAVADVIGPVLTRLTTLAPRPTSLESTGLTPELLADLALKHLLRAGSLTLASLCDRLGLLGPVIEPIVQFLRQESRLQLQARASFDKEVRLTLTDRGRQGAQEAFKICGYLGPAPVPIGNYEQVARAQTVPRRGLARAKVSHAYRDIIIGDRADVGLVHLSGSRALIGRRMAARKGHFMPTALLDDQFAALQAPSPEERAITVDVDGTPAEIVDDILRRLPPE